MIKMILDVDTGIDDALAIAYAIASPEIELLGITVTYGNTPIDNAFQNTCELLERIHTQIPVYKGAEKPISRSAHFSSVFHGTDGLGETLGKADGVDHISADAVDFIIEQVNKYGPNLTIVTTGPVTNLAQAIMKDPSIITRVGSVVTMGGAVTTPGNVNKFAEANIFIDPEAADMVLRSELPITLVGLDVTRKTLLTQKDMQRWRSMETGLSTLFADFTEYYLNVYQKYYPFLGGCALHDPLAVAVAKDPSLVRTIPMFLKVDLEQDALGRTAEDLQRASLSGPNTFVSVQVDSERFMNDFYNRLDLVLKGSE
ncbi:nucleoside hydrolase [Paenibacillus foliorum]|nr:nucleoside hydrolase [Paenibacillus foliorum]